MDTNKYLVKLTPYEKFFFGGENTFGDGHQANYLVKSQYFPQQTGILGLIRHQLLLQCKDDAIFKDNKIQNKKNAGELIGARSFRANEPFNFGKIKSLSPVFMTKGKDSFFFPANKEYQIYTKLNNDCITENINVFLQLKKEGSNFIFKDYDPKFTILDLLINNCLHKLKFEDVFIEHKQVGIRKKYDGGTDDEAYYVQTFLKIKEGFSFAFIVELEENTRFASQNLVVFGGEQQVFKMDVEDFDADFDNLVPNYQPSQNFDKIVLVSDTYTEIDSLDLCNFALTETQDFRFIQTVVEKEKNYYTEPVKSQKFNLYKKGSVFYFEDGNSSFQSFLDKISQKNFIALGYNHYKEIEKRN